MYFFAKAVAYCSICILTYVRGCSEPTKDDKFFQQRVGVRFRPGVRLIALLFTLGLFALLFTAGLSLRMQGLDSSRADTVCRR